MPVNARPCRCGQIAIRRACCRWVSVLTFWLIAVTTAFAQQGRGTILGTVTDSTGIALPGVTVEVANVATDVTTSVTTNAQGAYSVPNLLVGEYTVTFSLEGFSKTVRAGILLEVDQRAQVDVRLEVGSVSEVVEVNARASRVDTTTATLGKVVENRQIQELPLNGRNALSLLLLLTPAVQSGVGPSASGFADRGTELALIRINGSPLAANNFLVDGLSSTNPYYPDLNISPTVDAVQEFKVQTNTMSSEYGFTLGGVVNLVTKSGTNSYHGTLYEFVRNDALDANSWQNNRTDSEKAPLDYNQFGGSLGGPVRLPSWLGGLDGRGRSFFFYNFEGYEFTTSRSGFLTVPTDAMHRGDFSELRDAEGHLITIFDPATTRPNPNGNGFIRDPFPGNIIPEDRLDPVAQNITAFYPLPNRTPDNAFSRLNNYVGTVSNEREFRQHVARLDHRISDRNQLAVRYVYSRQFTDQGTSNLYPDPVIRTRNDPFRGHNFVVTDQHTFSPTLLHETRFGLAKQVFDFTVVSFGGNWPQQLGLPTSVPPDTFPQIRNGLPAFMTGTVGNRGGDVWQLADTFTWLRGNHSLKFGTQLRWTEAENFQAADPSGDFTFSSNLTNNASPDPTARINTGDGFATFMLGAVSRANVTTHLPEEQVGGAVALFFNDEWRVSPRLSLSLGVRYDLQQQPSERNCGTSNFNPFATNPTNGLLGRTEFACVDFDRPFARTDTNDVAPRVGWAWDLLGDQSTVVRGGYGMFYAGAFQFGILNLESTNGFGTTSTTFLPPGNNTLLPAFQLQDGFPSPALTSQGADFGPNLFALTNNAQYREADQPTPVSHQWGLSVQRQLAASWVVEAAYSGNRGLHLIAGNYDVNQADPALIREFGLAGELDNLVPNPFAGQVPGEFGAAEITQEQALRPTPYVGGISVRSPHLGSSTYHSLLLSAQKRFSGGFSFLASYTYAHFESDSVRNPINFVATEGGGEFDFQNGLFDRDAEWSEDPSNVPHRLVLSGVWDLPIGRGRALDIDSGLLNAIAGGWQLNGIGTFVSGAPLIVRGASNGLADRPDLLRDPSLPKDHVDEHPERGVLFFDPTAFANPQPFTFGNAPRAISSARTPGAAIVDLSLFKTVRFSNGTALQFRLEAFNALNHVNLGRPAMSFGAGPDGLNSSDSFGRITTARAPRQVQVGIKLIF
jgi:hypothetical protein